MKVISSLFKIAKSLKYKVYSKFTRYDVNTTSMKRIVIKVKAETDRYRKMVWKIAAETQGVESILFRESSDQIVVTGKVDAVCLTNKMRKRKKLRYATLLIVEDVIDESDDDDGGKEEDENSSEDNDIPPCPICTRIFQPSMMYPPPIVYDPYPNGCTCTIM